MDSAEVERARQHLKEKNFFQAVKELKKASRSYPDDGKIHFMLGRALVLLGRKEKTTSYLALAEDSLRKAIKLEPFREKYHDLLIEIKAHAGQLHELSANYRRKQDKTPNPLYEKMLKKITTVGVLSIPEPKKKSARGKHRGYYFIHYVLVPAVVATAVALWILDGYSLVRNLATLAVVLYVGLRISLKPSSKKYEKW